uniref:Uncharacterized protein n=1 Tax=Aegilops tauschii subsp. strangulata TaxID=200361 RepID=A0A453PG03_AEGTS
YWENNNNTGSPHHPTHLVPLTSPCFVCATTAREPARRSRGAIPPPPPATPSPEAAGGTGPRRPPRSPTRFVLPPFLADE